MIHQKDSRQNDKTFVTSAHSIKKNREWNKMEKKTYKYFVILMTGLLLLYCNTDSKQSKVSQDI